jgi:hypothetical protein
MYVETGLLPMQQILNLVSQLPVYPHTYTRRRQAKRGWTLAQLHQGHRYVILH